MALRKYGIDVSKKDEQRSQGRIISASVGPKCDRDEDKSDGKDGQPKPV